jgi:hypothetical protein
MRKSRFTDAQIAMAQRQAEAGTPVPSNVSTRWDAGRVELQPLGGRMGIVMLDEFLPST